MPGRNKYVFIRPAQANFDWAVPGLRDAESVGLSVADLLAEVESEWAEQEHMHPVHVPASWRHARRLYQLAMPNSGCWIIAADKEFIAAIGSNLAEQLKDHCIEVVTAAGLSVKTDGSP